MKERKRIAEATAGRYRKAGKKEKGVILTEFGELTGFARSYAAMVLRNQGRPANGTDGNIPGVEIESMRFYLDGKEIRIPRRLYADCFEPNFGNDYVTSSPEAHTPVRRSGGIGG